MHGPDIVSRASALIWLLSNERDVKGLCVAVEEAADETSTQQAQFHKTQRCISPLCKVASLTLPVCVIISQRLRLLGLMASPWYVLPWAMKLKRRSSSVRDSRSCMRRLATQVHDAAAAWPTFIHAIHGSTLHTIKQLQ